MLSPSCLIIENSQTYYFPDSGRPGNGPFPPIPTSPLPCEFGLQIDQQGLCSNFGGAQQCPRGFVCLFGPADEPGPCCLSKLHKLLLLLLLFLDVIVFVDVLLFLDVAVLLSLLFRLGGVVFVVALLGF